LSLFTIFYADVRLFLFTFVGNVTSSEIGDRSWAVSCVSASYLTRVIVVDCRDHWACRSCQWTCITPGRPSSTQGHWLNTDRRQRDKPQPNVLKVPRQTTFQFVNISLFIYSLVYK